MENKTKRDYTKISLIALAYGFHQNLLMPYMFFRMDNHIRFDVDLCDCEETEESVSKSIIDQIICRADQNYLYDNNLINY
jgi:hypothetical protein